MHRTSIVLSAITTCALVLSLANQVVIASEFGVSTAVDSFIAASSIPWLVYGLVNAMISYSLIPTLVTARLKSQAEYEATVGAIFWTSMLGVLVIVIAGIVSSPLWFALFAPGKARGLFYTISIVSWCAAGCGVVASILGAIENANNKFLTRASANLLPYAAMCISGVSLSRVLGVASISYGQLAGQAAGATILLIRNAKCLKFSTHAWSFFRKLPRAGAISAITVLCYSANSAIDSYWMQFVGDGALASVGYASRISIAIGSVIVVGPLVVLGTRLTELHSQAKFVEFQRTLKQSLASLLAFSVPAFLVAAYVGELVVGVLFERGSFSHQATLAVADLLPFFMVGMIANLLASVVMKSLISIGQPVQAMLMSLVFLFLYALMPLLLVSDCGATAMAISYAAAWWAALTLGAVCLIRSGHVQIGWQRSRRFFAGLAFATVAFVAGASIGPSVLALLVTAPPSPPMVAAATSIFGLGAYLITALLSFQWIRGPKLLTTAIVPND